MSIGYEGSALGVMETDFIDCSEKTLSADQVMEIISHNLKSLERLLDYNIASQIGLYGLDSNLIPVRGNGRFARPWWEIYRSEFFKVGEKIREAKIRISLDLSQTTVLDDMNEVDLSRSIEDLEGYAEIFKALGLGSEHKIILKIGHVKSSKNEGVERFKKIFNGLDKDTQARLALRNDENSFNIMDIMEIGKNLNLPVIFHNKSHETNPSFLKRQELEWIRECKDTWKKQDGNQIISYADCNAGDKENSAIHTIGIKAFLHFYENLVFEADIMLEADDGNLSAVKCINCIRKEKDIKALEVEWSKYKYSVLENSHGAYLQIRALLKEKKNYPVVPFYILIEEALAGEKRQGFVNAVQHVWGYFKKCATEIEKNNFLLMMEEYHKGKIKMEEIKKSLWELSIKYEIKYLLESYYFIL